MAGFGPCWQQAHTLGRQQVAVPEGMREHVIPGIKPLLASVRTTHPDHPLLPTLEAVDWLADVFVEDLPIKLLIHGRGWAQLFPREVAAVTSHPSWLAFAHSVVSKDAASKRLAAANRDFHGNPVQVSLDIVSGLQNSLGRQGVWPDVCSVESEVGYCLDVVQWKSSSRALCARSTTGWATDWMLF